MSNDFSDLAARVRDLQSDLEAQGARVTISVTISPSNPTIGVGFEGTNDAPSGSPAAVSPSVIAAVEDLLSGDAPISSVQQAKRILHAWVQEVKRG